MQFGDGFDAKKADEKCLELCHGKELIGNIIDERIVSKG
jgi:hypothetical protein